MHSHRHAACIYTLHSFLFNLHGLAHTSFYTNQLLHQPAFTQTRRSALTQTSFYTHTSFYTNQPFRPTSFTQPLLWVCRPQATGPAECRRLLNKSYPCSVYSKLCAYVEISHRSSCSHCISFYFLSFRSDGYRWVLLQRTLAQQMPSQCEATGHLYKLLAKSKAAQQAAYGKRIRPPAHNALQAWENLCSFNALQAQSFEDIM